MKSSFIRLNQLSRAFPYRGSMTKGFKYSIFLAFGNCSSQSNDARVLASKGAFGTCPGRELDSWMAILFYYWQFFRSWLLLPLFLLLALNLSFTGFCDTSTYTTILFPPIFFTVGLWGFQNTSTEFNEPIRAHNKYMQPVPTKRGKSRAKESWLV